jgi:hypothetical protein
MASGGGYWLLSPSFSYFINIFAMANAKNPYCVIIYFIHNPVISHPEFPVSFQTLA